MHNPRSFSSTFLSGALCGIAAVWIADELRRRRRRPGPRLVLVRNNAASRTRGDEAAEQVRLKRDEPAGDPGSLAGAHAESRPVFERQGGAPGGSDAAEVHEVPGHPGNPLSHADPATPLRSARRTRVQPPSADAEG